MSLLETFHRHVTCRIFGHRWSRRVAGGRGCRRCRLWQDNREPVKPGQVCAVCGMGGYWVGYVAAVGQDRCVNHLYDEETPHGR